MTTRATVTASGRLSLPADLRRRHGLAEGGEIIIQETDDAIVLRTVDQVLAEARAIARSIAERGGGSVDDFLSERREDAARE
ncbi:AbrB/MazE/SpoVT family DNA-binding domain-containing protein [Salinarimonas rosea]|uniref:AbrB/MazE/SpoVT family DNA-binding domain-containing protein n=1 Tax=Salinarimonas rosea TaxID=552063 RepID=UPI00049005BE|nr:AbrB/MazE/SpoVT family DNA-binding domain-containing protein [Salinarimonas rosea]